ncbi:MAG TPA: HAMP domain-containing sensor histidine kinase [Anaeromyxobacteraceae bacterium]|nr:HAMP domain-containing sensor histidine kinase [Anaeromyxobacteraceae bacterium]
MELTALLLDGITDYALVALDPWGRVQAWGRGAERVYGFPGDAMVGERWDRLFLPHDGAAGRPGALLELALRHGRHEEEALRVRRDGSTFWAHAVLTPLRGERGEVRGFAEVARDVTDRREAEQALRRLSDARSAVRARDEFLALAAHELKTPLTALGLNLQAMVRASHRKPAEVVATLAARTERLQRHVDRMSGLVETLLDVGRVASGQLELRIQDGDVAQVAARVASRCVEERGGRCCVDLDAPEPVPGRFDPHRVEQVLFALLDNGLKYGGGGPVQLSVRADGRRARVAVRDQGIGIAPEDQERIFQRFERAAPATQYGGFGFGLWAARQLVKAHGGEIRVRSAPGEGSTFEVLLPLCPKR